MNATLATHAILAVLALVLIAAVWVNVSRTTVPKRGRPARAWPVDFAGEIKAYRCRKHDEFLAGPDGRDRLPMTGRRAA